MRAEVQTDVLASRASMDASVVSPPDLSTNVRPAPRRAWRGPRKLLGWATARRPSLVTRAPFSPRMTSVDALDFELGGELRLGVAVGVATASQGMDLWYSAKSASVRSPLANTTSNSPLGFAVHPGEHRGELSAGRAPVRGEVHANRLTGERVGGLHLGAVVGHEDVAEHRGGPGGHGEDWEEDGRCASGERRICESEIPIRSRRGRTKRRAR